MNEQDIQQKKKKIKMCEAVRVIQATCCPAVCIGIAYVSLNISCPTVTVWPGRQEVILLKCFKIVYLLDMSEIRKERIIS